jgi:hypothetical protein
MATTSTTIANTSYESYLYYYLLNVIATVTAVNAAAIRVICAVTLLSCCLLAIYFYKRPTHALVHLEQPNPIRAIYEYQHLARVTTFAA